MSVSTDRLNHTFAALADPTRRAILASLARGNASVQELARPFNVSLPAISRHLKVLERAGLIERSREAQWRPCRLKAEPLREVDDWLSRYRAFWEASFDRLDAYLKEIQRAESNSKSKKSTDARKKRANVKGRAHDDGTDTSRHS